MGLKFENALEFPGGFLNRQIAGPHPRVLDSVDLGLDLRNYTFNKFPVDGDIFGEGTTPS